MAELPLNEADRLLDLQEYKIMDTPPEPMFDDLVQLAANIARVPMAVIVLLDARRQWFKSAMGITCRETARELSFCNWTILGDSLLLVRDMEKDERFCDNTFVTGVPGIRFYAGVPLMSHRGNPIGTLCVLDILPNDLDDDQCLALNVLGKQVIKLLELKKANDSLERFNKSQGLLMGMILRDIKSPLASTGTFLNLLQKNTNIGFDMTKFAGMAARQFNGNLALLDCVVEWGMIYSGRKLTNAGMIDTAAFIDDLISDLGKISYSGEFTLINKVPHVQMEVSCSKELYFIIHCAILWLFDCAYKGEIVVGDMSEHAQGLAIRMTMTSKSLVKTIGAAVSKLNAGSLWQDNPDLALDGLPFRLAKDIAVSRNGSLVASYEMGDVIGIDIYTGGI